MTSHCDNAAVVEVVNSGYSRDGTLAQLLRVLFFAKAQWDLELRACHIAGQQNVWHRCQLFQTSFKDISHTHGHTYKPHPHYVINYDVIAKKLVN